MNLISQLIMQVCMLASSPDCVETLHVCMRDEFKINFFDELTWQEELVLPVQIEWCVDNA